MFACSRNRGYVGLDTSSIRIKSLGGMSKGFMVVVCRACADPPCAKVCPVEALTVKKRGGVKLDKEKCIGCGNCQNACLLGAVFWNEAENKPVFCTQCGYCVQYCPYKVIELQKEKKAYAPQ